MNDLKSFRIGTAFYVLENKKGSKLRLNVNYGENSFDLEVLLDKGNLSLLRKQAEATAKYMLGKKAKKNLVEKLLQLKV